MPSKPQYRTLVRALDELQVAALDVLEPFTGKTLGPRMKALRRAAENASEVVHRAEIALEGKARKDGRTGVSTERRAGRAVG